MSSAPNHPASWWAQLLATSERFDAAYFVEELANLLIPEITNPLVRREVELAVATSNRHLLRPGNEEFADDADAGRERLASTLERLGSDIPQAEVLRSAVWERYAEAAAGAERLIGSATMLHLAVTSLRFERFDTPIVVRMLNAGRRPADAIKAGRMLGRYGWWPKWVYELGTEFALAGRLDDKIVAALDRCAYAPLSTAQTHIARRLFSGDITVLAAAVSQLENMGEYTAADALREGDLTAIALAAKLMTL